MKKFLLILLVLSFLSCVFPVSFAENAAEPDNLTVSLSGETLGTPVDLAAYEGGSAGCQFVILSPAIKIEICCPTWSRPAGGFLTMSIYKFEKDYETTVGGNSIKSVRYDEFDDNQWLSLEFTAEEPLPAGEYIVLLDEPEPGQASGVWLDYATDKQLFYSDGYYDEGNSLRSRVTFLGTPENTLGTPTKPSEEGPGENTDASNEPYMDYSVFFSDEDWDYILAPQIGVSTDFEDGHLLITVAAADDPQLQIMFNDIGPDEDILVEKYPIMMMKVRRVNDTDPTVGEIFFFTETAPGAKSGNNFRFDYENTLEWQYVTIDLSSNRR